MKLLLCADHKVGLEITRILVDQYAGDLAMVVTVGDNEIFHLAKDANVPVRIFATSEELMAHLQGIEIDLGLLAWWPKLIASPLLDVPRNGFINTHPSLLPYNRGKHYNFWAIIEEVPFGVTLHRVDAGIDSGDILAQAEIEYDWCDNGGSLYRKAQDAMVDLFRLTYPALRLGDMPNRRQDLSKGSFHRAAELESASHIDLDASYRGRDILNRLRARTFHGHPGCWFEENGKRYEVRIDIRRIK
jgi:methionyl-tRNA formyltransferase